MLELLLSLLFALAALCTGGVPEAPAPAAIEITGVGDTSRIIDVAPGVYRFEGSITENGRVEGAPQLFQIALTGASDGHKLFASTIAYSWYGESLLSVGDGPRGFPPGLATLRINAAGYWRVILTPIS